MKRQWRIQRDLLAVPDGQQRWDRAYQHLLIWSRPGAPLASAASGQATAEVEHEGSDLRASIDAAAGAGADD